MSVFHRVCARASTGLFLFAVFAASDALGQTVADIGVSIGTSPGMYTPGATPPNDYQFAVINNGPDGVANIGVSMAFTAATVTALSWTCTPTAFCNNNTGTLANLTTSVNLGAGQVATFTLTPTYDADATTSPLIFTASFTGAFDNTDGVGANDSQSVSATINPLADVSVSQISDGVTTYTPGGSNGVYAFSVSNLTGPSNILNAPVSMSLGTGASLVSWTCTPIASCDEASNSSASDLSTTLDLDAGDTANFSLIVAYAASSANQNLTVTASASVPAGVTDGTTANDSSSDTDTRVALANLSISVDDGSATYTPGTTATYNVVVSNAGPSDAIDVTVLDMFSGGLQNPFSSVSWTCSASAGGSCNTPASPGVAGTIDDIMDETIYIAASGTATFIVTADYDSAAAVSPLINTATLTIVDPQTSDPGGAADDTNTDSDVLARQVNTSITKTSPGTTVVPGQDLEYTIIVTNAGPSDLGAGIGESGVLLTDTFDPILLGNLSECIADNSQPCWQYCDSDGGISGASISRTQCPDGEVVSGSGNISNLPIRLSSGSNSVVSAFVRIGTGASGSVSNTASITAPQEADTVDSSGPGDDSSTDTNNIVIATDIDVTKTDSVTTAIAGSDHQYTITVRNSGFLSVTGVVVNDSFPIFSGTGAGYESGSVSWTCAATSGACCQTQSAVCDLPTPVITDALTNYEVDLPPQSEVVFTVDGTLDPLSVGILSNTATGTLPAGITESDPGDNSSTDDDTVVSAAVDLTINKQLLTLTDAGSGFVALQYQIVVTNLGPSFANDAVVMDPFTDTRFDAGILEWTCTVSDNSGNSACAMAGPVVLMPPPKAILSTTVDLDPGDYATFILDITAAIGDGTALSNTATVSHGQEINLVDNSSTASAALTGSGDLAIVKNDFLATATPGTETEYTIIVSNEGPDAVFGATVSDTFSAQLTEVSWSCDATTPIPGDLTYFAKSDQTNAGSDVLISPDGRHLYVTAPRADAPELSKLLAFTRNNIPGTGFGQISILDQEQQGVDDVSDTGSMVDGLEDPQAMAMDSLGQHLYVVSDAVVVGSDEAVTLFGRNNNALSPDYGKLSFVALLADGMPMTPRGILLSSDQSHVYVTGDSEIAIYSRDGATGVLTYIETHATNSALDGGTLVGAGAIVSGPGGAELYVASATGNVIATYTRETDSGSANFGGLTLLSELTDPQLASTVGLVISADGKQLYGASSGMGLISILNRDLMTGVLSISGSFDNADLTTSLIPKSFASTTMTGVDSIAISGDGEHVIAGTSAADSIMVFRRSASGLLGFEQDLSQNEPAFPGQTSFALDGVSGLLVSQDGRHVLTTATNSSSLGVFERRAPDPLFSFIEVEKEGVDDLGDTGGVVSGLIGASAVVVSRDGGHVYGAGLGSDALVAFERAADKGTTAATRGEHLSYLATYDNTGLGITGLADVSALAVSPDNRHLFASSVDGASLVSFLRDNSEISPTYGELTLVAEYFEGVGGIQGLLGAAGMAVDPATRHLYVAGKFGASVSAFQINADGTLVFINKIANGDPGVNGLGGANAVVVSPDGEHVVVASSIDDRVVVLKRNTDFAGPDFGKLLFVQSVAGVGDKVLDVAMSTDGEHVYAVAANDSRLTVLRRITDSADLNFGKLSVVATYADGEPNHQFLQGARSVKVSPDGRRVYVGAELDNALSIYDRDQNASNVGFGGLIFVEARRDEVDGVDGLNQVYAVDVSQDSRNVYAAGFTDMAISAYVLGVGSSCTAGGSGNIDDIVDIGSGGTLTYTATGTIRPDALGVLSNTATVTAPAGFMDPDLMNNSSTDTTSLLPVADLNISKTNDRAVSIPGEPVTYTVTVTNAGPSNATDGLPSPVTVTDILGSDFSAGTTWSCQATGSGSLSFVEASIDNVGAFTGLDAVTSLVTVPNMAGLGPHLVAVSVLDNALLVFQRDASSGSLTQVFQDSDIVTASAMAPISGARAVTVSPDGNFVYVASQVDDSVSVFSATDDAGSVRLTALEFHDFSTGVFGLNQAVALALSPAGEHLYVAGANSDTLVVFARNAINGLLTHVETLSDGMGGVFGLAGVTSLAVSADGAHLYATAEDAQSLAIFARNATTGALTQNSQIINSTATGINLSGAASVTLSPLGDSVYVVSVVGHSLNVFARDNNALSGTFGELTPVQELLESDSGVAGLFGARDVLVSGDGFHVYVASEQSDSVAWFGRDTLDGSLVFGGLISDTMAGNNGLDGAGSVAIDALNQKIYVAGVADDGIALLQRSADSLCPASGSGDLNAVPVNVAAGGSVVFTIEAVVSGAASGFLNNSASVSASIDPTAGNDTTTDTDNLNPTADLVITKTDGLAEFDGLAEAVAITGNGRDIYVASRLDNGIGFFQRQDAAMMADFGQLSYRSVVTNGVNGVSGLGQASDVLLSGDGRNLYVAGRGDNSLVVFSRNATTGELSFVEVHQNGFLGVTGLSGIDALAMSPDGEHVYATGPFENAIAVFDRTNDGGVNQGRLVFTQSLQNGVAGVAGLQSPSDLVVSPDGLHVYVTADSGSSVSLFQRNPSSGSASFGQLTYVSTITDGDPGIDGIAGARAMALSQLDAGLHLYVLGPLDQAVAVFERDAITGSLTFVELKQNGTSGVAGLNLASSLSLSRDEVQLYVAGGGENSIVIFDRNALTGSLTFDTFLTDGDPLGPPGEFIDGLQGVSALFVSPDDEHVYAVAAGDNSVAGFDRNNDGVEPAQGSLYFAQLLLDGLGGVAPGSDLTYIIEVTNLGPSDVVGATVVDIFPPEFATVSYFCAPSGGAGCDITVKPGSINENVNIPAGDSVVFSATGTLRSDVTGSLSNTATVSLPGGVSDPNSANNSATDDDTVLTPSADLIVSKTNNLSEVIPGAAVTYTVQVMNPGPSDALDTLVVDLVPESVTDVSWSCIAAPEPGLLGFVQSETTAQDSFRNVAVSADGVHLYAVGLLGGSSALSVFVRDQRDGTLTEVDTYQNGTPFSTGIASPPSVILSGIEGASAVAVSGDGNHVYVVSEVDDALVVFSRDSNTGELSYSAALDFEIHRDGLAGVNGLGGARVVKLSPDDSHLYVGGYLDKAIAIFDRNQATGALTFLEAVVQGQAGVDGLNGIYDFEFNPGGTRLYAVGESNDGVVLFDRVVSTGLLTQAQILLNFQTLDNALAGPRSIAIDNDTLYVASFLSDGIAVIDLDADTGLMSYRELVADGVNGVSGLLGPESVVVAPGSRELYVASSGSDTIGLFRLNNGNLTQLAVYGTTSFASPLTMDASSLLIPADGQHMYISGGAATPLGAVDLLAGSTCSENGAGQLSDIADLSAGGVVTYTINGLVLPQATGTLVNTAVATEGPTVTELDRSSNFATDSDILVPTSDMSITKTDNLVEVVAGTPLTYDINVFSPGPSSMFPTVSDMLPVFPASNAGFEAGTATWACSVGKPLQFFDEYPDDGSNGLAGASHTVLSSDDAYLYVSSASGNSISVFSHASNGDLAFVAMVTEGDVMTGGTVAGLNGANGMAISADGAYLYAAGEADDSVVSFARNSATGLLEYQATLTSGVDGVFGLQGPRRITMTDDGSYLYVAATASDAITVFSVNPVDGQLTFVERVKDGLGTIVPESNVIDEIADLAISLDGRFVYAVATRSDAISVYQRDLKTGKLTFIQVLRDGDTSGVTPAEGLDGVSAMTISPNGDYVYVVGTNASSMLRFQRDINTGLLIFETAQYDGDPGAGDLATPVDIELSGNGARVFVLDAAGGAVSVYDRDPNNGTTLLVDVTRNIVDGPTLLLAPTALALTADGIQVISVGNSPGSAVVMLLAANADCLDLAGIGETVIVDLFMDPNSAAAISIDANVHPSARGVLLNSIDLLVPTGSADPNMANNNDTDQTTIIIVTDVHLLKQGPAEAIAGESLQYTLTLTNSGPSDALDVNLIDTLPGALTNIQWTCVATGRSTCPAASGSGNLNETFNVTIDGSVVFAIDAQILSSFIGLITNTATAVVIEEGANTDTNLADNVSTVNTNILRVADLSISKSNAETEVIAGLPLSWDIQVINLGPSDDPVAFVGDLVPGVLDSVAWTCTASVGSTCTASGTGDIADTVYLQVGGVLDYVLTAFLPASAQGTLVNTATVIASVTADDPDLGNNSASDSDPIIQVSDLSLVKDDLIDPYDPAGPVPLPYTISITNGGPSDAHNVFIVDTVETGVTHNNSVSCFITATGAACSLGTLPTFSSVSVNLEFDVAVPAPGTLLNTATVTSDSLEVVPGANTDVEITTLVTGLDIRVSKTNDVDFLTPGELVSYTVSVENIGSLPAGSVDVSDFIPPQLINVTWTCVASDLATCTSMGTGDVIDSGDYPSGGLAVYVVTGMVDPMLDLSMNPEVSNTATATVVSGLDVNELNNTATDTDPLRLEIFKDGFEG